MAEDKIDYWHNTALPDVGLSLLNVNKFEFDRHVHLDYHIGVVTSGCQQYLHRGSKYSLSEGMISTFNPDEMHNGHSGTVDGYAAHVMAVPPEYIFQICQELNQPELFFHAPLIDDPNLSRAFLYLHQMTLLNKPEIQHLLLETTMMAFITEMMQRHAGRPLQLNCNTARLSEQHLLQVKDMFHADPSQPLQLHALAEPLGLSKFQFLRQFKAAMGMTPHAYFKHLRLEYAKKALIKGGDISDIAFQVGFFDQSHLNKAFKQAYLTTPNGFQSRIL